MIVFITLSFTSIDSVYYVLRYHLQVLIVNIGLSEGSVYSMLGHIYRMIKKKYLGFGIQGEKIYPKGPYTVC